MSLRWVKSHPEILQSAVGDGINAFLREVLIPHGFIKADRIDELYSPTVCQQIAEIAKKVADSWATCKIEE